MKKQKILNGRYHLDRSLSLRSHLIGEYERTALKLLYQLGFLEGNNSITIEEIKAIDNLKYYEKWDYMRKRYIDMHGSGTQFIFFNILEREGYGKWAPNGTRFIYNRAFPTLPGHGWGGEIGCKSFDKHTVTKVFTNDFGKEEKYEDTYYTLNYDYSVLDDLCSIELSEAGTKGFNKLQELADHMNKLVSGWDKVNTYIVYSPADKKYIVDPTLLNNAMYEKANKLL